MTDIEKLILKIMKECEADGEPVTREEAKEMAEMEIKAKGIKNYVQSDITERKERKPREKKIDDEKAKIIQILHNALVDNGYSAIISNVDKSIDFDCYTVNLVKHRPPKK